MSNKEEADAAVHALESAGWQVMRPSALSDRAQAQQEAFAAEAEHQNNVLVTGAVWMALLQCERLHVVQDTEDDGKTATNAVVVRFPFMKSAYRLTVERIPES